MAKKDKVKKKENRKKFWDKAVEVCAEPIFALDEFHEIWDDGMKALWDLIVNGAAAIVDGVDFLVDLIARCIFFVYFHIVRGLHLMLVDMRKHRKALVRDSVIFLFIFIGLFAILNYATGYEYAYKGKILGVVKDQDDVFQVVEIVSENLSKEYGNKIEIDPEEDIAFTRIFTLGKEIDDIDMVLSRLSNMSDAQAEAYAIRIDGKNKYYLETRKDANSVLNRIMAYYVPKDKWSKYETIGFMEDVKVVKVDTITGNIKSPNAVFKTILKGKKGEGYYKIKKGDTISGIAKRKHISIKTIRKLNPKLDIGLIHSGQKILIAKAIPSLTVKTIGIETYKKKTKYKTIYKDSKNVYRGETRVARAGVKGVKSVTARITRKNGKKIDEEVISTKVLKKPVTRIVLKGTKKRPPTIGSGHFAWPVHGASITSYFGGRWGRMHEGIDLACSTGTPIYAADGGTVTLAGWHWGYGLCVIIDHKNGYETLYGHCNNLYVSVGTKVYKGKKIAAVGNTGNSYGSHCHFEIHRHGTPVNPLSYL
ncbi:MAG: peptidoglycan DD-metalloendopeptidase family protein [Clostridia bacterium]|nr:peptidoglycan DD-metalloendopeptidase family protein [Clostridia bacterium]